MTRILSRPDATGNCTLPRHLRLDHQVDERGTARAQATHALLSARLQARALLQAAQATAQAETAQVLQAGWEQGYAAGLDQARREQAAVTAQLAAAISGAVVAHEECLRDVGESVVALTIALARVVLQHEVTATPETILHVARAALREMAVGTTITLRAHPGDAALLEAQRDHLGLPTSVAVAVIADETVTPGGCQIESGVGRVDATIETQLERMGDLLYEQLGTAHS